MDKTKEQIRKAYGQAVEDYTKEFCRMYDFDYEPDCWVADDPGGIAAIGDYFFDFADIRYCVDRDVPEKYLLEWYDYRLRLHGISEDIPSPNLPSWCRGCPRHSEEEISGLERKRDAVRRAEAALRQAIEELEI